MFEKQGVLNEPHFLHIPHGHFSGIHFLISPLKECKDDFCFISVGIIFQIF